MAREILGMLGGSDWAHTREAVYSNDRGEVGRLATRAFLQAVLQTPRKVLAWERILRIPKHPQALD